jgi:hypothetical protein
MLDQMVIRVARKGERVEPERIDRRVHHPRKAWPRSDQVLHVMAEKVVADRVIHVAYGGFEIVKLPDARLAAGVQNTAVIVTNRGDGKDAGSAWVDFQIDSQASRQQRAMPFFHGLTKLRNQLETKDTFP